LVKILITPESPYMSFRNAFRFIPLGVRTPAAGILVPRLPEDLVILDFRSPSYLVNHDTSF